MMSMRPRDVVVRPWDVCVSAKMSGFHPTYEDDLQVRPHDCLTPITMKMALFSHQWVTLPGSAIGR